MSCDLMVLMVPLAVSKMQHQMQLFGGRQDYKKKEKVWG